MAGKQVVASRLKPTEISASMASTRTPGSVVPLEVESVGPNRAVFWYVPTAPIAPQKAQHAKMAAHVRATADNARMGPGAVIPDLDVRITVSVLTIRALTTCAITESTVASHAAIHPATKILIRTV